MNLQPSPKPEGPSFCSYHFEAKAQGQSDALLVVALPLALLRSPGRTPAARAYAEACGVCDDTPEVEAAVVIWLDGSTRNPGFTHSPVDYGEDPVSWKGKKYIPGGCERDFWTINSRWWEWVSVLFHPFSRLICTTVAMIILLKVNTFTELVSKIDHQSFVEMQLKMDWEMITRKIREVWTMKNQRFHHQSFEVWNIFAIDPSTTRIEHFHFSTTGW